MSEDTHEIKQSVKKCLQPRAIDILKPKRKHKETIETSKNNDSLKLYVIPNRLPFQGKL